MTDEICSSSFLFNLAFFIPAGRWMKNHQHRHHLNLRENDDAPGDAGKGDSKVGDSDSNEA